MEDKPQYTTKMSLEELEAMADHYNSHEYHDAPMFDTDKELAAFTGYMNDGKLHDTVPARGEYVDDWFRRRAEGRHRIFVEELVAHGNRRLAYQKAYPGVKNTTARINACKLLGNPDVARQVQEGLAARKQQELELLKKLYDGRLTTIEEKRAILAKVIRGEMEEANKQGKPANLKDILKAIMIDNKMEEEWKKILLLPDSADMFYGD